jgi:hypothetical protein
VRLILAFEASQLVCACYIDGCVRMQRAPRFCIGYRCLRDILINLFVHYDLISTAISYPLLPRTSLWDEECAQYNTFPLCGYPVITKREREREKKKLAELYPHTTHNTHTHTHTH